MVSPSIQPEEIERLVSQFESRISRLLPQSRTFLSGSSVLGEVSGRDVDLVVLVADVATAAERLRSELPVLHEDEWRDDWAAFRTPGPPQVDVVLTREGTLGDAHHRRVWELIVAEDSLRADYVRRKEVGMTDDQKRLFFERAVARLR
jgi:hypothetical protein